MKDEANDAINNLLKNLKFDPNLLEQLNFIQKETVPEIKEALTRANKDYLHWEELQYKSWLPIKNFSAKEDFWALVKHKRNYEAIDTPIRDKSGRYYRINIARHQDILYSIDQEMYRNSLEGINFPDKSIINTMDEAITSSQFEGANTSRAAAKKMLLEGRAPHDVSETMIKNNHLAMLKIEQEFHKEELSLDMLFTLHKIITHETSLARGQQGILRETFDVNGNRLAIRPWGGDTIVYTAPDKEFVEAELPKLIDFANDKQSDKHGFFHPVIKAVMLHFWVGLLHPFEDGNGRLARVLFYWYLFKQGYETFKYLSLSEKILNSREQYNKAYIYSEQDPLDLTYFLNYNIKKIELARKEFQEYIKKKNSQKQLISTTLQDRHNFNERQMKLLQYLKQDINSRTNLAAYQSLYLVKKGAAIADLKELVEQGFLTKKKVGRNTFYYPTKEVTRFFTMVN
jgi:Fic family protein